MEKIKYYKLLIKKGYIKDWYVAGKIYREGEFCDDQDRTINMLVEDYPADWKEVSEEEFLNQNEVVRDSVNVKPYYKGKNTIYQFADERELNSYEFDIVKRITRCRLKGNWLEDLEKTKEVIDIYIEECKIKYNK